jgi:hypothetical protein
MNNELSQVIDFKLTPKQQRLLDVLADPLHARKTNEEKAGLAGISVPSVYNALRSPNFIQALRVRGLSDALALSVPIIKRMSRDALDGKYMQQKTMLEMSGHITQTPLVQQFIANINKSGMTEEEADIKIASYFATKQAIDAEVVDKPVDNVPSTEPKTC